MTHKHQLTYNTVPLVHSGYHPQTSVTEVKHRLDGGETQEQELIMWSMIINGVAICCM